MSELLLYKQLHREAMVQQKRDHELQEKLYERVQHFHSKWLLAEARIQNQKGETLC